MLPSLYTLLYRRRVEAPSLSGRIDAYSLDRNFEAIAEEFRQTGDGKLLWEAHFAGIEREYCQIEKLANLDRIPRPHGFKVSCLPIKIQGGSGGWCRAVAFV